MTSHSETTQRGETDRNPAEYPVLGVLAMGPAHGYDICRKLQEGIGSAWWLGKSQVYALLTRLEKQGLVTRVRIGQETLPAKNIFTLSSQGKAVFRAWIDTPVTHVRNMRLEFPTKLWFARQQGVRAERELIEKQLSVCREKANGLKSLASSCEAQVDRLSASFRAAMVGAAIVWLEGLLSAIDGRGA